jgi:hypothetical protein
MRTKDELEHLAEVYNTAVTKSFHELHKQLSELLQTQHVDFPYTAALLVERFADEIRRTMTSRDSFGVHSKTGRALYAHIAHPTKNPAPPSEDDESVIAAA